MKKETNMTTYEWNDPFLKAGPLAKPVRVRQRDSWDGRETFYTAIPLDMLDSIRAMLKACGFKLTTYYVGPRPAYSWMDKHYASQGCKRTWSVIAGTTRKENARYAKILVSDGKGNREYL
jgi:hypothetical protein